MAGPGRVVLGDYCSGLVMAAFASGAGIALPHSTYALAASPHLHQISLSQAETG